MAETLNWRQMGATTDLPTATDITAGDILIIETPNGYKRMDYATLLAAQTEDLGNLGEGFGTGVGNLSLRQVPTDYIADGTATTFVLKDSAGAVYTPGVGDVVAAFVGGVLDATVVLSGSTVIFSDPPPAGEYVRLFVFSPVTGSDNTAALDTRYVRLVSPAANGYVLAGNANGGAANSGIATTAVLTTSNLGAAGGPAPLNAASVVPTSYLPAAALAGATGDAFAADHPTNTSAHPLATSSIPGFMAAADKAKLDNLPDSVNLNSGVIGVSMNGTTYTGTVNVNYAAILAAPLASPGLTGTPTAPNAAAGTNTNQIATTAFVQGEKVNTALTGTPTAPTAANTTNTNQVATTAFVNKAVADANLGQYVTTANATNAYQPKDGALTNFAAVATNGILVITDYANNVMTTRTLVAGSGVTISNPDGTDGDITINAAISGVTEVTRTPIALFGPQTAFNGSLMPNIPTAGCVFPSAALKQPMDLTNVTAVDFMACVTTAGSVNVRVGPRFSIDGGTTWRDAKGNVIGLGTAPLDQANVTVSANATGQPSAVMTLGATVRTSNTLVSYFTTNGNGSDSVQTPTVRVSAAAVVAGTGLITATSPEFVIASGTLALTRLGKRRRYVAPMTIGGAEEVVVLSPASATTYTLTTDTSAGTLIIYNTGTAVATVIAGGSDTLDGGTITLAAPASATAPVRIALYRDPDTLTLWRRGS